MKLSDHIIGYVVGLCILAGNFGMSHAMEHLWCWQHGEEYNYDRMRHGFYMISLAMLAFYCMSTRVYLARLRSQTR